MLCAELLLQTTNSHLIQVWQHVKLQASSHRVHKILQLFLVADVLDNRHNLIREHAQVSQKIEFKIFDGEHPEQLLYFV